MAEQTPSPNRQEDTANPNRQAQERQPGTVGTAPGQRVQPPQRGLLKRIRQPESARLPQPGGRALRKPISPTSANRVGQAPVATPMATVGAARTGRPVSSAPKPKNFTDPGAERMKREQEYEQRRKAEEERKKQELAEKNRLTAEQGARKKAEADRRRQELELARQRAEEEKIRRQKEAALRKAEAERNRLEKEAEAKRLEEERIQKEKEAEQKRLEAEKIRQEEERQWIFTKIENCLGSLDETEVKQAQQIAMNMVARNVHWRGYISLTSGIGGAMRR